MNDKIKEVFKDFMVEEKKLGAPITIWVPIEYKNKYNAIQQRTKSKLCKKIRELILAGIDEAESILK